jgi:RNA-directed DNA polymerase
VSFSRELFIQEAKAQNRSEGYIKYTIEYADGLVSQNLPVIFSKTHLALLLNVSLDDLNRIMIYREAHYAYYPIRKRRGGVRQISSPYSNLKEIQRWIHLQILAKVAIDPNAKGFAKKQSIKENAEPHRSMPFLLNLDLLKFFDSISEYRVYLVFEGLGYAKNVARDLARFSAAHKKIFKRYFDKEIAVLPQGAPTSPGLSNIILISLDRKMALLAAERNCQYTRYADDITFSSDKLDRLPSKNKLISIVKEEDLFVNFSKLNIYTKGQRQLVTGLTITDGVHIPKSYRKDVYTHLFYCLKYGPENHLKWIKQDEKKFYKEWLLGRIHYINSINEKVAKDMYQKFSKIKWSI